MIKKWLSGMQIIVRCLISKVSAVCLSEKLICVATKQEAK